MEKKIDFLEAYKKPRQRGDFSALLKRTMVLVVILYCFSLIGIIGFWSFLEKENKQIKNQIEVKKSQLTQLKKKESLQFLLKYQLSALSKLWSSTRTDFSQILSFFLKFSPEGLELRGIKISNKGEIQIEGVASHSLAFANFLEKIIYGEGMQLFSRVILNSLSRQADGSYNFSFTLNL